MSSQTQKAEKPVLQGQRIKTRKRDEKEKYDPSAFRDSVIQGLNEAGSDLEQVSKYLDSAGAKLDYRRYAEPLLDILFAGGILAPGGTVAEDNEDGRFASTQVCVFTAESSLASIKAHYEIFYLLIRRYKYLEKNFGDELKKLIVFLKGFTTKARTNLATITGIFFANGLGNPSCLSALFDESLVKEGIAIEFATVMFKAWLSEKDIFNVSTSLRKAELESQLMNLLPINRRSTENFENHFRAAGLDQIIEYQRTKATAGIRKELQAQLDEMIRDEEPVKEITITVKEQMKKNSLPEKDVVVMVWRTLMATVEWNKKEDLIADQALRHLRLYSPLLASLTTQSTSELALLLKVQEYCYDNMNFMKVFQKIVMLFYQAEVLSEDVILHWYKTAHLAKGKSVFLDQMRKFVEWLKNAEEESDDD